MKTTLALITAACLLAAPVRHTDAAVFTNGSFEAGPTPGSFVTLNNGDTSITGWTVVNGDIDYIGSYWLASDGTRSLDLLNGNNTVGGIAQTFDTAGGQLYHVDFDMAGNPDGPPVIKNLDVDVADAINGNLALYSGSFLFDSSASSHGSMGWVTYGFDFVAGSASSTLRFVSGDTGFFGAALDNVTVTAVPEPTTIGVLGLASIGLLARRRRRIA